MGDTGSILQSGELPSGDLHSGPLLGLPGGAYSVTVSGPDGHTWEMQGSTNLLDWTPLINRFATNATMQFIDYAATNFNRRF